MRVSAGFGLAIPTPLGRLEINYVRALRALRGDLPLANRFGLQFGFCAEL